MKLEMAYVAVDADNVGEQIGNAVLSNDENQLSDISQNINSGVGIFSQWAEGVGGKVISSGSDEAIFKIPTTDIEKIEEIKDAYTKQTGFSISIGIGNTVSEAAKALIYAKVNGKDQIVDYSPEIERAMKQAVTGNVLEGGVGDKTDPKDLPQDELEEGIEHEKEHTDDEEIAEEIATDHLTEDDDYYSDLDEMESKDEAEESEDEEETEEIEVPTDEVDGDYGSEEMEEGQPEHEKEMDEEEEFVHDAQENREDEADDDIIEADMEEEVEEEAEEIAEDIAEEMEEDSVEDVAEEMDENSLEDVDLDGEPDVEEEHGQITEEDDIDADGDIEHEEAVAAEEGQEDEYSDENDVEDEITEEEPEELSDSIESEMDEEDGQKIDQDSLKQVIYQSLQSFKQNKEFLDGLQQENPELYGSLIYCLQAMIEMSKELGYGKNEEINNEEINDDEPMLSDEDETMSVFEGESDEDFEKAEMFKSMAVRLESIFKKMSLYKKEDGVKGIEELKQEFKQKIKEKMKSKSSSSSKKQKSATKKTSNDKKKKDKKESQDSNDGSFCARSHQKMRASGKDCRANEDKNSPLCSARRKYNCRGKNEEKGAVQKTEKLHSFLKKKELKKSRLGTAKKQTTKTIRTKQRPVGALNLNREIKVEDPETGETKNVDASRGLSLDNNGNPIKPEGASPKQKQKTGVAPKVYKI